MAIEKQQADKSGKTEGGPGGLSPIQWIPVFLFYGVIFFAVAYNFHWFDLGQSDFRIVAAPVYEDSLWSVSGRVLIESGGARDVVVWAVASNDLGHSFGSEPAVTDTNGFFKLTGIPPFFKTKADTVIEVSRLTITATPKDDEAGPDYSDYDPGETELSIGSSRSSRIISLPGLAPALLAVAFLASILATYLPISVKANYLTSVTVAFFFVVLMVGYIAAGMGHVTKITSGLEDEDILSLGVGYIYKGNYVDADDVADEWVFSLTSKPEGEVAQRGFGAPLWVIFLAVIGAGLYTLSMLVEGITSLPHTDAELAPKLHSLVLHQLYVFFAPIGAIFVYQLVVAADAAREPLTVGFSVLAAGIGLTWILRKSKLSVSDLVGNQAAGRSGANGESAPEGDSSEAAAAEAAAAEAAAAEAAAAEAAGAGVAVAEPTVAEIRAAEQVAAEVARTRAADIEAAVAATAAASAADTGAPDPQ